MRFLFDNFKTGEVCGLELAIIESVLSAFVLSQQDRSAREIRCKDRGRGENLRAAACEASASDILGIVNMSRQLSGEPW